jgi:hypothetical protein
MDNIPYTCLVLLLKLSIKQNKARRKQQIFRIFNQGIPSARHGRKSKRRGNAWKVTGGSHLAIGPIKFIGPISPIPSPHGYPGISPKKPFGCGSAAPGGSWLKTLPIFLGVLGGLGGSLFPGHFR